VLHVHHRAQYSALFEGSSLSQRRRHALSCICFQFPVSSRVSTLSHGGWSWAASQLYRRSMWRRDKYSLLLMRYCSRLPGQAQRLHRVSGCESRLLCHSLVGGGLLRINLHSFPSEPRSRFSQTDHFGPLTYPRRQQPCSVCDLCLWRSRKGQQRQALWKQSAVTIFRVRAWASRNAVLSKKKQPTWR